MTEQDLKPLLQTLLFGDEDRKYLRMSRTILEPQVEKILDTWYGFVASTPHLLAYFANDNGVPQSDYLAAVRTRFGQWILATAAAEYDADWLAYQHEIGLRHHRTKKNQTDGAHAVAHIHFRYLVALAVPITETLRPFLAAQGHNSEQVDAMHSAWRKAVLLQVILWSEPYVNRGDF